MTERKKTVAVLTQSPALSSIIAMVLDCEEDLNVQIFGRAELLKRHARIVPNDLIVCDFQIGSSTAPKLAIELRQMNSEKRFSFIMLTAHVDTQIRQACAFANIDEVIVKPMSPLFLRDRVLAQLQLAQNSSSSSQDTGRDEREAKPTMPVSSNIVNFRRESHSINNDRHPEH
ncbi:MAG: response regulator [Devosiaceae bacterium]|nr:response regulator [Devosiaceae bacterium]